MAEREGHDPLAEAERGWEGAGGGSKDAGGGPRDAEDVGKGGEGSSPGEEGGVSTYSGAWSVMWLLLLILIGG